MDTFTALSDFASFDTLYDVSLAEGMAASEASATLAEPYVFVDYLTRDAFFGWESLDAEGNFILAEMEETELVAETVASTSLAEGLGAAAAAAATVAGVAAAVAGFAPASCRSSGTGPAPAVVASGAAAGRCARPAHRPA